MSVKECRCPSVRKSRTCLVSEQKLSSLPSPAPLSMWWPFLPHIDVNHYRDDYLVYGLRRENWGRHMRVAFSQSVLARSLVKYINSCRVRRIPHAHSGILSVSISTSLAARREDCSRGEVGQTLYCRALEIFGPICLVYRRVD